MPVFADGQTIRSREPTLLVENRFAPGVYRFRLVVVDDERNASAPAELVLRVVEGRLPLDPVVPEPVFPGGALRPDTRTAPLVPPAPAVAPRSVSRTDSTEPDPPRGRRSRRTRPER